MLVPVGAHARARCRCWHLLNFDPDSQSPTNIHTLYTRFAMPDSCNHVLTKTCTSLMGFRVSAGQARSTGLTNMNYESVLTRLKLSAILHPRRSKSEAHVDSKMILRRRAQPSTSQKHPRRKKRRRRNKEKFSCALARSKLGI